MAGKSIDLKNDARVQPCGLQDSFLDLATLIVERTECIFVGLFNVEVLLKIKIPKRFAALLRDAFVLFSINPMFHINLLFSCPEQLNR